MLDMLIRGGVVVTDAGVIDADVGIKDGTIVSLAARGTNVSAAREYDAFGLLVLPGLIDPHVHLGHKVFLESEWVSAVDDFGTGTAAAACGGTTVVIDFAIQRDLDPLATVEARRAEASGKVVIDFGLHAALTRPEDRTFASIPGLIRMGVSSFKLYMIYRKQGRMADDAMLLKTFSITAREGALAGVHAENSAIAEFNTDQCIELGQTSAADFARAKPNLVESEAVNRALFLAERTGARLYVFHISTKEGLELIAQARTRQLNVNAETCPHYLVLTEDVYKRADGHRYICSPPLRSVEDVDALWRGIRDGYVTVVSSDHCGFDAKAKDRGEGNFVQSPNGLPGVELRLPLMFTYGVQSGRLTLSQLVRVLSTNPARIFGLFPTKGVVQIGSDADLVVLDPGMRRTVRASDLASPVDWSPYEGIELQGWPVLTIARGDVVAEWGRCVGNPGRGRFLRRGPPVGS
jgi:dihydropyrimidinase